MNPIRCLLAAAAVLSLASCGRGKQQRFQGYVEGEFVYVSSPRAGKLEVLAVERGAFVRRGDPLFELEPEPERAARDQASERLGQAQASLEDARKGKRPSEIESLQSQLRAENAALLLSRSELERQERLLKSRSTSQEQYERARARLDQDRQRVAQLSADLLTAGLGQRPDQVAAAEREVKIRAAALAQAQWELGEKEKRSPAAALVFDTLYRPGEFVSAAKPVVVLLPPENIKVRAFIPEDTVGRLRVGGPAEVSVDGIAEPFGGTVSFISPQAEFSPPVIFSRETRTKLVFMIEIRFAPRSGGHLHPGQPVDVRL